MDQYSNIVTATSASAGLAFTVPGSTASLALQAYHVEVGNITSSSSTVFITFTTTSGASTGDWPLRPGCRKELTAPEGCYFSGLSYRAAASTSSSVALDVLALG